MSARGTIRVRVGHGWIAILLDKSSLILRSRARLPKIDDVRNPLIAHAAIGSREVHGCSKEHAL